MVRVVVAAGVSARSSPYRSVWRVLLQNARGVTLAGTSEGVTDVRARPIKLVRLIYLDEAQRRSR